MGSRAVLFGGRNCLESSVPSVNRSLVRNTFCNAPLHYPAQCEHSLNKNISHDNIKDTHTKLLSVQVIRVFPLITSIDNTVATSHWVTRTIKSSGFLTAKYLLSDLCLNKNREEMKLQSFNLKENKDLGILCKRLLTSKVLKQKRKIIT